MGLNWKLTITDQHCRCCCWIRRDLFPRFASKLSISLSLSDLAMSANNQYSDSRWYFFLVHLKTTSYNRTEETISRRRLVLCIYVYMWFYLEYKQKQKQHINDKREQHSFVLHLFVFWTNAERINHTKRENEHKSSSTTCCSNLVRVVCI